MHLIPYAYQVPHRSRTTKLFFRLIHSEFRCWAICQRTSTDSLLSMMLAYVLHSPLLSRQLAVLLSMTLPSPVAASKVFNSRPDSDVISVMVHFHTKHQDWTNSFGRSHPHNAVIFCNISGAVYQFFTWNFLSKRNAQNNLWPSSRLCKIWKCSRSRLQRSSVKYPSRTRLLSGSLETRS